MVTHQEPDILVSEVKWGLESTAVNKASEDDGIPAALFQTLKDDAVALNRPAGLENSAVATGLEKVSFHSKAQKGQRMPKNVPTTAQLHSLHMLAK